MGGCVGRGRTRAAPSEIQDWIGGTDHRFGGYNYVRQHPEVLVGWFDTYINCAGKEYLR